MKKLHNGLNRIHKILEQRQLELVQGMRKRDGIAIEKSADQMDEIQYASERDLAIRMVDRESVVLRDVRAALQSLEDGNYGICSDCEEAISPNRLAILPWASRCVQCQERADQQGTEPAEHFMKRSLVSAGATA